MKRITALLTLLLVFIGTVVPAQETARFLTLEEAISIAKDHSPDALTANLNYWSSHWEYMSYRASNRPGIQLNTTLPYLNQTYSGYLDEQGNRTYVRSQYISSDLTLGITQKIGVTGGSVSINSSLSGQFNADGSNPYPYLSVPVKIVLNQPVFKFNADRWARKIEPMKYALAKRKYLENMEQVSITTINYFFNLLQAQVERKIALVNLSNYDTLFRIAKGRFQLGKIAENDLLQMELNFLKAQSAVENANLTLENTQFRFKSFLRLQDSTRVILVAPSDVGFFTISPAAAVELANEYSSSSIDFRKRLLEAEREVNAAKLNDRFDANIRAEIGLSKSGETVHETYVKPLDDRLLLVELSIPLLDWGVARGKIKMAQSEEEVVRNTVEQDYIDLRQNVYLKAVQFNMQKNQVTIAAKSDTVARKSFEVTKGRYLIGKINSILDLNNAQIETDNAEMAYYRALQTYWQNYYEIRKLTLYDFSANIPIQVDFKKIK
jgi:outer membrane protein TolC